MAKPDKPPATPGPAGPRKGGPPGKGKAPAGAKAAPVEKAPASRARSTGTVPPRLRERFRTVIVPALMKERGYGNPHQVPRLAKVVVNVGVGEAKDNAKVLDFAVADLVAITGQRPVVTKARKSIAAFKVRTGMPIGVKVTLRGARMYEFLDRLVNVALPRVRDFKGVSPKSFDGRGNYTLGIREEIIFPEVNFEKLDKPKGMNITFNTTAANDEQGRALLRHLGMPFRN